MVVSVLVFIVFGSANIGDKYSQGEEATVADTTPTTGTVVATFTALLLAKPRRGLIADMKED